ncbi:glycosyltransferase family 2 protein [Waltera intestinalis]|uniref:Glycosyltransferase n=1 Tax=Waltera intestinalis TaxID=2606635 RepID=A0A6L5YIT9_9FIRM|nr:glycosyltransferase [Waltera intestinalis]MST58324.1 glycosyltransferase [Waltera intestinalis]
MFKVSVIIPVYNTEEYLEACLESVINQSLKELEIVLIDDGSTDTSPKIIHDFKMKYPERIQVITKENGGQGAARNMAIPVCRGEYIGFVDSDDYIEPEMYEKMYCKAKETDADYVECDYKNVKINDKGEQQQIADYGSRVRAYTGKQDMFIDPMLAPWNKIYRAELLKKSGILFPEGVIYEDTAFCLKAISMIQRFAFVPEKYVMHFYRGGSTMNVNKARRVGDIFAVLQNVISFYREVGLYDTYREELEYCIVKILLCSSMLRIAEVSNRKMRKQFCNDTWNMIKEYFPEYKHNKYIKCTGVKNLYMRCMTGWNIFIFCQIFAYKR